MKKIIISLSLIIVASVTFTSCKNDLNVLAPGKEMVSVYGILNPTEPVQNIRINKVFSTTGDANVAAQNQSVINFDANELVVTLERYNTGSTTKLPTTQGDSKMEIVLTETVITTDDGAFNNQQRIWQTTDKLYRTGEYKLVIKKTSDLNTILASAQAAVIDSVKTFVSGAGNSSMPFIYIPSNPSSYPMHGQYEITTPPLTPQSKYIDYSVLVGKPSVIFQSILNAKIYSVIIRFHYKDSLSIGIGQSKYIDYNFPSVFSSKLTGGELLRVDMDAASVFYTNIGQALSKESVPNLIGRQALYMEYIISAGTDDLYTFLQVNAPSTTIAQDKPYYSNIIGGVGIFACRSTSSVTKDLWNNFIDKIACNPTTNPYLFYNSSGIKPPICP